MAKRWGLWRALCLGIGAFASLCLLVGCCGLTGPPARDCPITRLLLNEIHMPPGAEVGRVNSPIKSGPISFGKKCYRSADTVLYLGRGHAIHRVYRSRTTARAEQQYLRKWRGNFTTTEYEGPYEPPEGLPYRSSIADQYHLACGPDGRATRCSMAARYEEYVVVFTTHMAPFSPMTFEHLERALRAIDQRMAGCLGKTLSPALATD